MIVALEGFLKHLGILIFVTRGRDSIHLWHCVISGSGARSSHNIKREKNIKPLFQHDKI